jgi:sulfonate transport system permease protein
MEVIPMATHTGEVATRKPAVRRRPASGNVLAAALMDLARRRRQRALAVAGCRLALIVACLAVWQGTVGLLHDSFYAGPTQIWARLVEWFTVGTPYGSIWTQIGTTLGEAGLGFVIGAAAGMFLGVVLGRSHLLADVFAPFIKAADAMPRIVLASLFFILFGLGTTSKVLTVVTLVLFSVFFDTFSAVRGVDNRLIQQGYLFGASPRTVLRRIVLPIAIVRILPGLRRAFGLALIGALMGEYIGAAQGLGLLIRTAQGTFDVPGIYAGLLLTTVIALLGQAVLGILGPATD